MSQSPSFATVENIPTTIAITDHLRADAEARNAAWKIAQKQMKVDSEGAFAGRWRAGQKRYNIFPLTRKS